MPQTVKKMTKSQKLPDNTETNYGIGWRIRYDENNNPYLGHTGGSVGGTTFVFSSNDKSVISIMANASKASFDKLPYELINIFKTN
jgi:CubicO group peptidase (beta-lactamase class C family)